MIHSTCKPLGTYFCSTCTSHCLEVPDHALTFTYCSEEPCSYCLGHELQQKGLRQQVLKVTVTCKGWFTKGVVFMSVLVNLCFYLKYSDWEN